MQKGLQAEIDLIENTRIFFDSLLNDLREQFRKHKSVIYNLEEDIQRKKKALRIEKQNENLKTSDSKIFLGAENVSEARTESVS